MWSKRAGFEPTSTKPILWKLLNQVLPEPTGFGNLDYVIVTGMSMFQRTTTQKRGSLDALRYWPDHAMSGYLLSFCGSSHLSSPIQCDSTQHFVPWVCFNIICLKTSWLIMTFPLQTACIHPVNIYQNPLFVTLAHKNSTSSPVPEAESRTCAVACAAATPGPLGRSTPVVGIQAPTGRDCHT